MPQIPYGEPHRAVHKRAPDASCRTIDIEHMKRCMDGNAYASLENFAKTNWGADWKDITANPSDQPDFGLFACVVAPVPTVTFDDHPPCTSQAANSSIIATEDGNVKISYDAGVSSFTTATVVQAAVMPINTNVQGDISIPALGDNFDPFSVSLTLTNFLLSNDSASKADNKPTSVETRGTKGQECFAPLNNVTCTAEGYTRFQIASSGYLWFTYNTSRGTPPDTRTQWAVSIEQLIPDASLRSTYMSVNATTVATRLVVAGDAVCDSPGRFTSGTTGQTPGGTSSGGVPVYAYAVPVALVVLAALGGLGFYFWRRSQRASRGERQFVDAARAPSYDAPAPSISDAQTYESSGERRYDQWAAKLQQHARADAAPVRYANEKSRPYNS